MKLVDFDLKEFQEGAIAVTSLGHKVTHLHEFPAPAGEGHTLAYTCDEKDPVIWTVFYDGRRFDDGAESDYDLFLALDTVTIGEREVEGPMWMPPEHGKPYWVLNQLEDKVVQHPWIGSERCWLNLRRRCAFRSEKAATEFMNAVNDL